MSFFDKIFGKDKEGTSNVPATTNEPSKPQPSTSNFSSSLSSTPTPAPVATTSASSSSASTAPVADLPEQARRAGSIKLGDYELKFVEGVWKLVSGPELRSADVSKRRADELTVKLEETAFRNKVVMALCSQVVYEREVMSQHIQAMEQQLLQLQGAAVAAAPTPVQVRSEDV